MMHDQENSENLENLEETLEDAQDQNENGLSSQSVEERRRAEVREFLAVFPEAARNPNGIPAQVWQAVDRGFSLTAAYVLYLRSASRAPASAAYAPDRPPRQSPPPPASTGSMRSAGVPQRPKDPFLQGWDEA